EARRDGQRDEDDRCAYAHDMAPEEEFQERMRRKGERDGEQHTETDSGADPAANQSLLPLGSPADPAVETPTDGLGDENESHSRPQKRSVNGRQCVAPDEAECEQLDLT